MNAHIVSMAAYRSTPAKAPAVINPNDRVMRLPEMMERSGLARATIYRRMADPNDDFPDSVPLGGRSIGWRESDFNMWIASRGQGGRI